MSARSSVLCPMCRFQSPTLALSLSHLRLVHRNDPRFSVQCGISGCTYTGKSFSALYSHIYTNVGIIQKCRAPDPEQRSALIEEENIGQSPPTISDSQGNLTAMFLLQ